MSLPRRRPAIEVPAALPPPHRLHQPLEPSLAGVGERGLEAIGTGPLDGQKLGQGGHLLQQGLGPALSSAQGVLQLG